MLIDGADVRAPARMIVVRGAQPTRVVDTRNCEPNSEEASVQLRWSHQVSVPLQ